MRSIVVSLSLSVATLCYLPIAAAVTTYTKAPLKPVVFYHGMGDSAHSKGMLELFDSIKEVAPEIFIHSISVSG